MCCSTGPYRRYGPHSRRVPRSFPPPERPRNSLVLTLTRRPVDRGRRLREPERPCVGHVETILQPHAELAGDIDARFIREAHARGDLRRLPANEVDRLVPVEADAVAGAVR